MEVGEKLKILRVSLRFSNVTCIEKRHLEKRIEGYLLSGVTEDVKWRCCDLKGFCFMPVIFSTSGVVLMLAAAFIPERIFFPPTRQQAWPLLVPEKTIITPSITFQFLRVRMQDLFQPAFIQPTSCIQI